MSFLSFSHYVAALDILALQRSSSFDLPLLYSFPKSLLRCTVHSLHLGTKMSYKNTDRNASFLASAGIWTQCHSFRKFQHHVLLLRLHDYRDRLRLQHAHPNCRHY